MAINFVTLRSVLPDLAQIFGDNLTEQLIKQEKVASGETARSIREIVNPTKLQVQIEANETLIFIDQGRKPGGKQPPADNIEAWIVQRRIQPRSGQTRRALAFIFARSIARKGILPTNIIDDTFEISDMDATELICEAGLVDVCRDIEQLFTRNRNATVIE